MAKGEELLGSGDVGIVRVALPGSEATTRGVFEEVVEDDDVEVRLGEPLLLLQDPWYCSTSLYLAVRALKVNPPGVPKKWILKSEAPSHETAWVPNASSILDLRFQ